MSQIKRIPFRGSATLGRGVNTLTGDALGKALTVVKTETATSGQEAKYSVEICETYDALMDSMGLSIEAGGRYGLFSGEGKFAFSESSHFNAHSTFVVASCRVQNAFEMVDEYELRPDAQRLLEDPDRWKTAFGTSFVRGLQTGGEFFIVFQVTSTSQESQRDLSTSFHTSCQGLAVSADFDASYQQAKASTSQRTETSILMYQRAGQDEEVSYVSDPKEIIERLRAFPAIARANPAGYEVEVADYNTLALPDVNDEEVADREASLNDCARLRLKFMTRRNDIEFARDNRTFFADLPDDAELGRTWEQYSRAVSAVQRHAQKIAGRRIPPVIFDPSALEPALELPVVNLARVNFPTDIPVPDLTAMPVEKAKEEIARIGLRHESDYSYVDAQSTAPIGIVTGQYPAAGTMLQPNGLVRIKQNAHAFDWRDLPVTKARMAPGAKRLLAPASYVKAVRLGG
ncbi:PASTA domain-containing protein [Leekyejoonella antrihumi]|nr:PASTA domain-containing protein [Leekyejoonella antrihumi]